MKEWNSFMNYNIPFLHKKMKEKEKEEEDKKMKEEEDSFNRFYVHDIESMNVKEARAWQKCYICETYQFKETWTGEKLFDRSGDNVVKYRYAKHTCGPLHMHHKCIRKWDRYWNAFSDEDIVCPQCLGTKNHRWIFRNWFPLAIFIIVMSFVIHLMLCEYKCRNPIDPVELHWVLDAWANSLGCKCPLTIEHIAIIDKIETVYTDR